MRIPPHYRQPVWQRFLAGVAIGGMISWFIFLFIFGEWQERYSKEIKDHEDKIAELNKEKEIWQEEFKALNKKNRELLTIQEIKVKIGNGNKYKLDLYSIFEIEDQIKEDLLNMKAKDIDTVYKSRELIERIIENKTIKVNEKRYKVEVKQMVIYTTLFIQLEIMLD